MGAVARKRNCDVADAMETSDGPPATQEKRFRVSDQRPAPLRETAEKHFLRSNLAPADA